MALTGERFSLGKEEGRESWAGGIRREETEEQESSKALKGKQRTERKGSLTRQANTRVHI